MGDCMLMTSEIYQGLGLIILSGMVSQTMEARQVNNKPIQSMGRFLTLSVLIINNTTCFIPQVFPNSFWEYALNGKIFFSIGCF